VMKKKEKNSKEMAEEEERERHLERLKQETIRNKIVRRRSTYRDSYKASKKLIIDAPKPKT
jgi:hypothetical protein